MTRENVENDFTGELLGVEKETEERKEEKPLKIGYPYRWGKDP